MHSRAADKQFSTTKADGVPPRIGTASDPHIRNSSHTSQRSVMTFVAMATINVTAREVRFDGIANSGELLPKVKGVEGSGWRWFG